MNKSPMALIVFLLALPLCSPAQESPYYQSNFPPQEFQARWEKIFARIGGNGIALVQGAPSVRGFVFPRQNNEFFYLCGIETPFSYIMLDGRNRKVTLFLPPRNERLEHAEGKVISANDSDFVKSRTGVDSVKSTEVMHGNWLGAVTRENRPVLYVPFEPGEGYAESRWEIHAANAGIANDYWDGRLPREGQFIELLRARLPGIEIRDLSPILDELRSVKSLREIAMIRRASQIAGRGIEEAMKSTKPGLYEYQLDAAARYIFLVNGARLDAYRSIIGGGTANIGNMHYYRNTAELKEGDMVLMDYAPDYGYYMSDIARMFPVNGKFSALQKELLGFVIAFRDEILKRVRPGVTAEQIRDEAKTAMEPIFQRTEFSKPIYAEAARKLVNTGGGVFSHPVGMAVHDDGSYGPGPLKPGHVFSIDPQMWVPEENLYYRVEDVVVITEKGYENFTEFLPYKPVDIEALMKADGVLQKVPPTPSPR
jgi:Xaa-Pro aminopeptidase